MTGEALRLISAGALAVVLSSALSVDALAQTVGTCDSQVRIAGNIEIDLATPGEYVDVCQKDRELCKSLTSGYPASVSTLAYFVTPNEWATFLEKQTGFSEYLIAQLSHGMAPEQLPGFKAYVRSQNGTVPDNTELHKLLADRGRVSLGVVDESPNSISFGVVLKVQDAVGTMNLASINSAIVIRDRVLSLYAFQQVSTVDRTEPLRARSGRWLACLNKQNSPPPKARVK